MTTSPWTRRSASARPSEWTTRRIADRLDAFASLLELADANRYTIRAYRRAAETIRATPRCPSPSSCGRDACASCAGSARGSRRGCASSSRRATIAELAELERELAPGLVGLGRYLGLGAKRSVEIARALGVHTAGRAPRGGGRRPAAERAAASGRRPRRGSSRRSHARPSRRPRRGLLLNRARELVGAHRGRARRRSRRRCAPLARRLRAAGGGRAPRPTRPAAGPLRRAAPDRRGDRADGARAVGVTVEGVPVELVVAEPAAFGTALVRATGSPAYVAALEPLPDAADEAGRLRALGLPWCPPELREEPFRGEPPALVERGRDPRRSALPYDVVGRPGERRGDGPRRPRPRL